MDGGAWKAAAHGVTEGRTRLSDFTFTPYFHALENEMATRSSVLAWRIPGAGEPGGLPSMGSHRVGHDWSDLAAAAVILRQNFQPFLTMFWVLSESKEIFEFSNSDVNRYDKHVINCSFSTRNNSVALLRKSYCALFSESSVFWNLYSLKISQVF